MLRQTSKFKRERHGKCYVSKRSPLLNIHTCPCINHINMSAYALRGGEEGALALVATKKIKEGNKLMLQYAKPQAATQPQPSAAPTTGRVSSRRTTATATTVQQRKDVAQEWYEMMPGLYVGNIHDAEDASFLHEHKIMTIICLTDMAYRNELPAHIKVLRHGAFKHAPDSPLSEMVNVHMAVWAYALGNAGAILVHCRFTHSLFHFF